MLELIKYTRISTKNKIRVGAFIIKGNKIVAKAISTVFISEDPTAHGEINVIKKFPIILKFLRRSKDSLIVLSRLKDVITMMIVFHLWPEQTYRFSTRRHLPSKKNRLYSNWDG